MLRRTLLSSLVGTALLLPASVAAAGDSAFECANVPPFDLRVAASNRQLVPGGGALFMRQFSNPATMNAAGNIAFMADITFVERDEAIFVADESGPVPVVIACSAPGCGDPTPIGGTFSQFFESEHIPVPINDAGDVLFLANVTGGSAERGLFLYQAGSGSIAKVAAVGDPAPTGGLVTAVGVGTLNDTGDVVFVIQSGEADDTCILRWSAGTLTIVAAVGDPAPGGGRFREVGSGAQIYFPPAVIPTSVPSLNEAGDVSFIATVLDGTVQHSRIFVSTAGTLQLCMGSGDPAPGGGVHLAVFSPLLNNRGEIAFRTTVTPESGPDFTAWFRGLPGDLHRVISSNDRVDGGKIKGMGNSPGPCRALDDCGNLALWVVIRYPGAIDREATIIANADGPIVVVAREGDPTGHEDDTFTSMHMSPDMNNARQVLVSAGDTGISEFDRYSHFVFTGSRSSPIDGSVNSATGPVTNVLFVNDAAGDVVVATESPFTISLDAAPAGPASGRYFFYVWITDSLNPVELAARGAYLGYLSNPSPFHPGESPMPFRCVRGTGVPSVVCRGLSERVGPPLAPYSILIPGGFKHPIALRLQGVLQDAGAANALGYSVTNSVGLAVE